MPRSRREWNQEMRDLARRMNQLMDEWMHAGFRGDPDEGWAPFVDVIECRMFVYIMADLAGMKREDIKVAVGGNTVTLSGVRTLKEVNGQTGVQQMELGRGAFRRTVRLPFATTADALAVKYEAGLLEIKVPKPESAR